MSPSHGKFVWYELRTPDLKASEKFYGNVLGWAAKDAGMPAMPYTLFSAGDQTVAGAVTMPGSVAMPPHWMGFVGVDDVDAAAAKVKSLGGAIHMGPQDIPGVGRFAIIADPQGAFLALFKWVPTGNPPKPVAPGTPGHCGWHELYAGDVKTIFDFYGELFGWTKGDAVDIGPMGIYQLFNQGGVNIGGMMTKPAAMPTPAWLYYFNVDGIEAAAARVKASGGTICHGPMQVPGDDWIAQIADPQGAMAALTSRKK
jgi:predicted enzyme related to lactoylglutathione lyase